MKQTKIIFFDIDGTLIDMNLKKMTKTMEKTLLKLKDNGIKICLATGRPSPLLPKFSNIEFDAFLTFNGSYCYTNQEVMFKNPIPKSDVKRIVQNAKRIQRPVVVANESRIGGNGKDPDLVDYFELTDQTFEVVDNFEELLNDDIYQMMSGAHAKEYDTILDGVNHATITAWWSRAVDIFPADGGKGLGVEKMLEYYNFSRDEAIAFGDGTNDIEMLQAVGTGIAMGNATDDVKEVADIICGTCQEDGIYQYCREEQLI